MSIVIRGEGLVPLSAEHGIHEGSVVEWERAEDDALKLGPTSTPEGAGSRLLGILKPCLKEPGGGVEAFLEWRREDAPLDGSL